MINYYEKYIKYKFKYTKFGGSKSEEISTTEENFKVFEKFNDDHKSYTKQPHVLYSKHPKCKNVYCIFEKISDHSELNEKYFNEKFDNFVFPNVKMKILNENKYIGMPLKSTKEIGIVDIRWLNFPWFIGSDSPYNLRKYFNTKLNIYFAYFVLLDDNYGETEEDKLYKWLNTPHIDSRYLIIQIMVYIFNEIPNAIHFYINNYFAEYENDPPYIWGNKIRALSYKNQSILLHSFSANILKQYFQIINIWSSPNDIMYKIIINTFILFNLINTNEKFKEDIDKNQSQLDLRREYNLLSPDMIAESTNYKKELEINFSKIPEILDKHDKYFFEIRMLFATGNHINFNNDTLDKLIGIFYSKYRLNFLKFK